MDAQDRVGVVGSFVFVSVDLEIDIVDAHHFSSVDVDDLLVEQVALQEKEAFGAVHRRPISRRGPHRIPPLIAETRRKRKNAVPGLGFDDEG